jgi:hypothetical protein
MANEPSPEMIARAARLRAQIDQITNKPTGDSAKAASDQPPMSPREFVEREMRKLNKKE